MLHVALCGCFSMWYEETIELAKNLPYLVLPYSDVKAIQKTKKTVKLKIFRVLCN